MRISDWSSDVCSSDLFPATGVAVAVAAAISVATVSILLRQIGRTEATTTTVFWFTILSLPPLAIGMFFFGQAHDALTWGLLAIIGLAGGMGQLCLTGALRWAPVSVVLPIDRKSGVSGKSVSVRVGLGGRRIIKKKITR